MKMVYWFTDKKEFYFREFENWSAARRSIPSNSWVYDPDATTLRDRAGIIHHLDSWLDTSIEEFPPEFRAYLLLMGVH